MRHIRLEQGNHPLLQTVVVRLTLLTFLASWPVATTVARSEKPAGKGSVSVGETPETFFQLCPLEEWLFFDAEDGRLDEFSLLDAALVASGVQRVEVLRRYEQRKAALVQELRQSGKLTGTPRRRAQVVFEFMHRRVLHGGYGIDCTDMRIALDEGRFNCVSASVLFHCLASEVGLTVCGLEMPGHAMSRVVFSHGMLDVETTCPGWFRLIGDPEDGDPKDGDPKDRAPEGSAKLIENTIGRRRAGDRSPAREISPVQMTAMIYYNRGVDLLAHKSFDQAAVVNAKASRLDPTNSNARGNLLATINNWAIALGSAGRYAEAAELLQRGFSVDPDYRPFAANYMHVHHQWVEHLCGAGRFEEALSVLAQAAVEQPDREYFRRVSSEIYRRWARTLPEREEAVGSKR